MLVQKYLSSKNINYQTIPHRPTFLAERVANETGTPLRKFAKTVVLDADNVPIIAVVPATSHVDLKRMKKILGAKHVHLANENLCHELFPECEMGSWVPFGSLKGVTTFAEQNLFDSDEIVFESENHHEAIKMTSSDYRRAECPHTASIERIKKMYMPEEEFDFFCT